MSNHAPTTPRMAGRKRRSWPSFAVVIAAMAVALVASLLPAAADEGEVPTSGPVTLAQSLTVGSNSGGTHAA